MKDPRVIFAGTPEFARASLSALVDAGVVPVAVLTQPDRPAGRGKRVTPSPVKRYAEEHDIPVMQPPTLRDDDVVAQLLALEPDIMVVAAYGLILPQTVLDIPARGCLNVHASVLPRWRGAAPIQAAILAGDKTTGVSLMSMTAGLDCGPVYVAAPLAIAPGETAGALHDRLATLGGDTLAQYLDDILEQRITPVPQDESATTYAGKINKSDAQLDWSQSAVDLERRVRAYDPVPGAFFFASLRGGSDIAEPLRIKCWRAASVADIDATPGTVVSSGADGIDVACASGALRLLELQLPGKRRVKAREFAHQIDLTDRILS
ncbi:MAG: methionyl-tRNA formyltransferase [Woeseiaceae bacterium]|nr:methionyl-tRNA formyltransferase [Woeseiaceae bacterium]